MAAGLGFKTFVTGEVLTAGDTNGYLMQGVLVFASAAARDAAITSPQEGQCCYLKDTDAVLTYSGSAWVGFDDSNAIQNTIVDAKGDLIGATAADTPARLAVGTNGQVLTADSAQATGLKWATPSGPAFSAFLTTTAQSITTNTFTKVTINSETFDTANNFDSTTNYRFTPTTAGYYQLNATLNGAGATISREIFSFYKNGSEYLRFADFNNVTNTTTSGSTLMYFNGSTDYAELYVYLIGTTLSVSPGSTATSFSGVWIRS